MNVMFLDGDQFGDNSYLMLSGGVNTDFELVMQTLKLGYDDVERLRDAGYDRENGFLWLFARSGSTNIHGANNDALREHPLFRDKYDDPFEATYEVIRFTLPALLPTLKHFPPPDLGKLVEQSKGRMESGNLNEFERARLREMQRHFLRAGLAYNQGGNY
ncbi:hypothetical protein [Paenibacillus xylanexedens]|uniref:hypothetical protein n=1 Tax=Paenibacillus xylanexedens TaxID=528191 RepID=UPI0011A16762|nr:hypothetical protein [Paenibacillus xylanexedens]